MTLLGVLGQGRAWANARMTETVRVGTLGEGVDPDTLEPVDVFTAVYSGRARFKFQQVPTAEPDVAGQLAVKQDAVLSLPSGTTGITPDMRVIVDASTADTAMVGRVFRIKGYPAAGQTTAARFPVEETGEQIEEGS